MYLSLYCKGSKRVTQDLCVRGSSQLDDGFFFTASYQQLLWIPTHQGAPRAPSAWRGFPYHISSITPTVIVWLLSWLSYIIVQRPLNRLLDLRNGMFDRNQAEITVMQFTGHSPPVHHSEVGSSSCPILSALIRPRDLFRLLAIGMCHFLPAHHFGMACLPGPKAKIQQNFTRMVRRVWNKCTKQQLYGHLLPISKTIW